VTKSGAKSAKSDAQKYYKRRNDPAGLAKIEEGDVAFKDGDFAKAKALYDEATEICKNSSVEKTAKVKVEKEAKPQSEDNGAQQRLVAETISSTKLILVSIP
jgi:glutaminyl-tRNA synthetase